DAFQESSLSLLKHDRMALQTLAEGQAAICQLQMRRVLANLNDLEALYRDIVVGIYRGTGQSFGDLDIKRLDMINNFAGINYPPGLDEKQIKSGLSIFSRLRTPSNSCVLMMIIMPAWK
ncbi:MAG: hypothetical protein PHV59_12525, partial [Victivallales bacterium]|nr:hypothetical protein [Victivallales bacterium]